MEILIPLASFVLGYLAEKILDAIVFFLKKRVKTKKLEMTLDNFYTSLHKDVLITASGIPFFRPENINESINRERNLYLAPPEGNNNDTLSFVNSDVVTEEFKSFVTKNSLEERLEQIRSEVFDSFSNKEKGNYFNGKILGVNNINGMSRTVDTKELPILSIDFYETDYFTHKIIEQLVSELDIKNNDIIDSGKQLAWSRTSFGISLIIILPKANEILLTKRSNHSAYSEGEEWIYVSVTETISETDYNEETGTPDIIKGIWRGINEELGITERQIKKDTLRLYETFYETHFHQDNIVASVEVSETMTFSDIYSLLAKDKYMEVANIITISNEKKEISRFIEENKDQMRAQTIFSLEGYMSRL